MNKQIEQVKEFRKAFNLGIGKEPRVLPLQPSFLHHNLLNEENQEFQEAYIKGDKVGVTDAIIDAMYVVYGMVLDHGLESKFEALFNEVHASNMSKLEDGKPLYREDGKVMKGKNYFKPDIKSILEK